jgi:hypothetical protein
LAGGPPWVEVDPLVVGSLLDNREKHALGISKLSDVHVVDAEIDVGAGEARIQMDGVVGSALRLSEQLGVVREALLRYAELATYKVREVSPLFHFPRRGAR